MLVHTFRNLGEIHPKFELLWKTVRVKHLFRDNWNNFACFVTNWFTNFGDVRHPNYINRFSNRISFSSLAAQIPIIQTNKPNTNKMQKTMGQALCWNLTISILRKSLYSSWIRRGQFNALFKLQLTINTQASNTFCFPPLRVNYSN